MNILRLNGSENKGFIKLVAWSRAKRCVVDETLRCLTAYQLYHIDPEKKWPPFFRRCFVISFPSVNCFNLIKLPHKFIAKGIINNKSECVYITDWR